MEGLCMLLKRLAYPCRYSDMLSRFGRPVSELCMITKQVMDFNYDTNPTESFSGIPLYSILAWLLESYAVVIAAKGALQAATLATARPISKSGEKRRTVYNGHKRVHALKFHSVATPNELTANMFGPVGNFL